MNKKFALLRSEQEKNEWKLTAKGDMNYIFELLKLNLNDPNLENYDWKVIIVTY